MCEVLTSFSPREHEYSSCLQGVWVSMKLARVERAVLVSFTLPPATKGEKEATAQKHKQFKRLEAGFSPSPSTSKLAEMENTVRERQRGLNSLLQVLRDPEAFSHQYGLILNHLSQMKGSAGDRF